VAGNGTTVLQAGVAGPTDSADVDTSIRRSTPNTTYGTSNQLSVGVTSSEESAWRTLIAFDLSSVPSGVTITGCTLRVWVSTRSRPTAGHVRRLCGEHWVDGKGRSEAQATWNVWKTSTRWGGAGASAAGDCTRGADYTTNGQVAYAPPTGLGFFSFPDLTPLCRDAIASRSAWLRLRISQATETGQENHYVRFDSSEGGTPANRPRLTVTWSSAPSATTTSTTSSTTVTSTSSTSRTTSSSTSVTTTSSSSVSSSSSHTTTSTSVTTSSTTVGATVTNLYQAGVGGPAGSAGVDTYLRLSTPTTNWGTEPELIVGVTNAADKVYRTIVAFDLSDIPAGATVSACSLRVNVTQRTSPTVGHIRRLCPQHWQDGDGQSEAQATWSAWKTGANWGAAGAASTSACDAGGDYATTNATDEVPYTPPAGTGAFTFPDMTALCQAAIGEAGGWLRLRISQDAEGTQGNVIKFDSSDGATAANRPRLSVTWRP